MDRSFYNCDNCEHRGDGAKQCNFGFTVYKDAICAGFRPKEQEDNKKDNINHPAHYESGKYECIDVMTETQGKTAVLDFCVCNAFKYLYRHSRKNGIEDIKKAIWYLNKFVELSEG